jgi:putative ABC transport system substrate-binding protein
VDVIVTSGNAGVRAAREASSTIPIVAATFTDPVAAGFAVTLARPGGSITGLATQFEDLVTKQLQLLKESVPKAARVVVMVPPPTGFSAYSATIREAAASAAQALGVQARFVVASDRDEAKLEELFSAAKGERADAIQLLPGPYFVRHRARVVELAMKHRLPAVYELKVFAEAGGLMAYGPNFTSMYHRAAHYVDRVFKGTKPGDLPIEQPTRFELVVNLKTARALGITFPPSILVQADHVIE